MTWAQELTIMFVDGEVWRGLYSAPASTWGRCAHQPPGDANRGKFIILAWRRRPLFTAIVAYLPAHFVWKTVHAL